jgi:hypothetical protein
MKIFISSLITGMEAYRAAARDAVVLLKHEAVMAEDFESKPLSPQTACLQGLRQSGLVILILGEHYGAKQAGGLSATHQEYREARGKYPVLAFVENTSSREEEEKTFVAEVQGWEKGLFRGAFTTPEQLKNGVITAIHEWQLSVAAAPLDYEKLSEAAYQAVAQAQQQATQGASRLLVSVISAPFQAILRPAEMEQQQLADDLLQAALFGEHRIFDKTAANQSKIVGDSLILYQEQRASVKLDPQGGIVFELSVMDRSGGGFGMVIITELLETQIENALLYANWLLDRIDPTQRLTHFSVAAGFIGSTNFIFRTQAEQNASPNSMSMGNMFGSNKNTPVQFSPAYRSRASLKHDANSLTEDLMTLLKRRFK